MEFDYKRLKEKLLGNGVEGEVRYFFSPGRLEILGNHTDHNGGEVLVSPATLGIKAAVIKRDDRLVDIDSIGYGRHYFTLDELKCSEGEKGTPKALAKGVLAGCAKAGKKIGGFSAVFYSDIFRGAGVSSSAAYELMVGEINNDLFNEGKISRLELAMIGQYSENVYFGKPSGLLDQCGSSFGGLCHISFAKPEAELENLAWPFDDLRLFLVNPGLSHGKLTSYYASIPEDMKHVASLFGKEKLSEIEESKFYEVMRSSNLSEAERLRSVHFYEENRRVERAVRAIKEKNEMAFLEIIRASHLSSAYLLRNAMVPGRYEKSPLEAVELTAPLLKRGASRLMGGGFAGTTLNFLYEEEIPAFREVVEKHYGPKSVVEVAIPKLGSHEVIDLE